VSGQPPPSGVRPVVEVVTCKAPEMGQEVVNSSS
jgi:hypothetical protein